MEVLSTKRNKRNKTKHVFCRFSDVKDAVCVCFIQEHIYIYIYYVKNTWFLYVFLLMILIPSKFTWTHLNSPESVCVCVVLGGCDEFDVYMFLCKYHSVTHILYNIIFIYMSTNIIGILAQLWIFQRSWTTCIQWPMVSWPMVKRLNIDKDHASVCYKLMETQGLWSLCFFSVST